MIRLLLLLHGKTRMQPYSRYVLFPAVATSHWWWFTFSNIVKAPFLSQLSVLAAFQVLTSRTRLGTSVLDVQVQNSSVISVNYVGHGCSRQLAIYFRKILFFTNIKMEQRVPYRKLIEYTVFQSVFMFLSLVSLKNETNFSNSSLQSKMQV